MELDSVLNSYPGGGAPSYHPKMMLKVLIYAYTQKIYSSRMIAKALLEQIPFRWLSGGNCPDFRTINRYRSTRLNGQLKPDYNVQIGTSDQFILGYSIHQKPGDSTLLIPHLEWLKQRFGRIPGAVTADAGYGSEENYAWLDDQGVTGYVKYNNFHWEQKKKQKQNPFRMENLIYDADTDSHQCPAGKDLHFIENRERKSANGYVSERRIYEAEDCVGCTFREQCHKSKYNRRIEIGVKLQEYRQKARDLLLSPVGLERRSRRPVEPEAHFGQIKANRQFRRFLLRGLDKVSVEFGLVAIAHNLMKLWMTVLAGKNLRGLFGSGRLVWAR